MRIAMTAKNARKDAMTIQNRSGVTKNDDTRTKRVPMMAMVLVGSLRKFLSLLKMSFICDNYCLQLKKSAVSTNIEPPCMGIFLWRPLTGTLDKQSDAI